jgi:hypothetical protein
MRLDISIGFIGQGIEYEGSFDINCFEYTTYFIYKLSIRL